MVSACPSSWPKSNKHKQAVVIEVNAFRGGDVPTFLCLYSTENSELTHSLAKKKKMLTF